MVYPNAILDRIGQTRILYFRTELLNELIIEEGKYTLKVQ